ncbi:hypothetical protein [Burkholderia cepacia]|uniref:hypothetical protein n=1 Tax=Burkholderia cepacia TaxID=292 RepID=UPI00158D4803|nr:hypothetical protein [Burkholderia cepacia]
MPTFLISYDLKTSNDDNAEVRTHLQNLEATPILESVWIYNTNMTKGQVAESVSTAMKAGDKFVVVEISDDNLIYAEAPFSFNKYLEKAVQSLKFGSQ